MGERIEGILLVMVERKRRIYRWNGVEWNEWVWDKDEVLVEDRRCESVVIRLKYFNNGVVYLLEEKRKFGLIELLLKWEWI